MVLLAAEVLKQIKPFVEDGLHPQVSGLVDGWLKGREEAFVSFPASHRPPFQHTYPQ